MFDKATLQGHTIGTPKCTRLIQRPCYQRGGPCQDPAGNRTTRRPPDHRKETQTAVVWPCLPFIRSGQNHLARHSERGKKIRQTDEEVGSNFREWTGLEFAKSQRAVENRRKWRILFAKSSVVPQRLSRLKYRWDEMDTRVMADQRTVQNERVLRRPSQFQDHRIFKLAYQDLSKTFTAIHSMKLWLES